MRINILDVIYPVGSYYFTSEAVSPAASVGGSWEQIEEGTFLCAAGDTFVVNSRGGANEVTLALDEVPGALYKAWHNANKYPNIELDLSIKYNAGSVYGIYALTNTAKNPDIAYAPHENKPKYIAAFVWKRIS